MHMRRTLLNAYGSLGTLRYAVVCLCAVTSLSGNILLHITNSSQWCFVHVVS